MPHEQPATEPTPPTHAQAEETLAYESVDERGEWIEGTVEEELPRRPRRRLLTPVPLTLLGVLLIACGFIAGVLVEKGEGSSGGSSAASSGLASRFAALRSGAAGTGLAGAGAGRGASGASGAPASGTGSFAGGASGAGATVGQVAYLSGSTLYVTNAEGNTVKVKTSAASTVTKTVKADVKGIHPGETVIVTGSSAGSNGAIEAESIRVSEAGASGGLGALFGGGGSSGGATRRGGGGEPALFGG